MSAYISGKSYNLPEYNTFAEYSIDQLKLEAADETVTPNVKMHYTVHKIRKQNAPFVVDVSEGKVIISPNHYCLLTSIMNLTDHKFLNLAPDAKDYF